MARNLKKTRHKTSIPTIRVSVIVITSDERILLVRHRKGKRLYWVLPGGRLEYGETFYNCAVRELKEETGLEIKVGKIVFLSESIAPDKSRHIVNVYLTGAVIGGTLSLGDEPVLAGVEYVPLSNLGNITLFPPVGNIIRNAAAKGFKGNTKYIGNLWV